MPLPPPESLSPEALDAAIPALGRLLHDCVAAGASINFVQPFAVAEAEAFWRTRVLPGVRAGSRIVIVLRVEGDIAGSVQLDMDTPPNAPHRAEIAKLMVHPVHRRRGLARALMQAAEARALQAGRRLLTLDTRTGDAAEPLYAGLGYVRVGVVPGYCIAPEGGRLDSTTIMYKQL